MEPIVKYVDRWIHEHPDWPDYSCNEAALEDALSDLESSIKKWRVTKNCFQSLKMVHGMRDYAEVMFLTESIIKSSKIEGVYLDPNEVQKSIILNLEKFSSDKFESNRNSISHEGMVKMSIDANRNCLDYLSADRMFSWHQDLFQEGLGSEGQKIVVGNWRQHAIVVGNRNTILYEAPHEKDVPNLMEEFLHWFENDASTDRFVKVALCHLKFEQIHPFSDGNGRIGRTLCDLLLARINWSENDESVEPFHFLSSRIESNQKQYYELLNKYAIHENLDATEWVDWFLSVLNESVQDAIGFQETLLEKISLLNWMQMQGINKRQRQVLYEAVRWDFIGNRLTNEKYRQITGCNTITASRDLRDLKEKGILEQFNSAGAHVSYRVISWQDIEDKF